MQGSAYDEINNQTQKTNKYINIYHEAQSAEVTSSITDTLSDQPVAVSARINSCVWSPHGFRNK